VIRLDGRDVADAAFRTRKVNDMSERTSGVLFNCEDGIFFVPESRLTEFRIDEDQAASVRSKVHSAVSDEVVGFSASPMRPLVKPISWGFSGPIKLGLLYSLAPTEL